MNKKKAWIVSLGLATMLTANGLVMAATTTPDTKAAGNSKTKQTASRGEFRPKDGMKGFQRDKQALLEFLKIDENTFKAYMQKGMTLADSKGTGNFRATAKNFPS